MFNWKKLGRVFDPTKYCKTRPWLQEFSQAPSAIVHSNFVRIYFSCRPLRDINGQYVSHSAFVDLDRDNLFNVLNVASNPILPLGGKGEFDEFGTYPVSVIRINKKYRAYYGGWTRCQSVPFDVSIGVAESSDGINFHKMGRGPVLTSSLLEPFVISSPKIRNFNGTWQLFYIAGTKWKIVNNRPEPVYKIRLALSKDGLTWSKYNKDLIPSKVELDEAQASPDVFFSNGKFHMFFSYRYSSDFRSREFGYRIGYAYSHDLYTWHRDDSLVGITVSSTGWDSEMVSYAHVFELNNKLCMAYLGNEVGRFGFGIAELQGVLV